MNYTGPQKLRVRMELLAADLFAHNNLLLAGIVLTCHLT